ncbi:MAG: hypothetical protein ACI8P9_002012 [Parasphingorhabdus sp.]|jgi:hypothetical protein
MISGDIEIVYNAIAEEIDQVGAENSELFLAQLALLLAHALDDDELTLKCVTQASAFQRNSEGNC